MAEAVIGASKPRMGLPPLTPSISADDDLFKRRIEFHPARKSFSAFALSGGDFHIETLNPTPGPQSPAPGWAPAASAAGKRPGGGEPRHCGLDPELSFEITFRRIGAGLENLGNTCFLNSVLQCLTYTEPFAAYLQSGKHKSSCRAAGFCAMCALQSHVVDALQSTGKILRPFHLVKNLRCISRNFRNSRQEDAHEYMINLLESMHKCCLPSGVASESPSAYEKSLVHKIFGGRLRSQVKCMQCSYFSNKFDPFLDLSLEIVKADTLCKALSHFTAEEQLDGGERQYQCQQCKQKVRALKHLTIHKAPYVLTIHLKRFGSDVPGQKIDKKVEFEPTLDLKPYVSDPLEGDLKYTLYGVLVHAGFGTHSGHYFCFVRTPSGMWHSLNDHQVCQVSEKAVLQQKAYMLFYVRNVHSTPKTVHDDVCKDNKLVNASVKNVVPVASGFKEGIQDHSRNGGSTTSDCKISVAESLLKKVSIIGSNGLAAKAQKSTPSEKDELQNINVKVNGASNVARNLGPEQTTLSNHSHTVGNPDGLRLAQVDHQDAMTNGKETNDPVAARHNGNVLMEADQIHLISKQRTAKDSTPQKVVTKRKVPKSFYAKNLPFGSRRLFLVSLNLQRKKHRSKKRYLSTKDKKRAVTLEDDELVDEGTSTSALVNMVDVDTVHSTEQRFYSSLGKENNLADVNCVSIRSANANYADVSGRYVNNSAEESSRPAQQSTIKACTFSKSAFQHGTMNSLKRGFWELSVPKWDGIELPPEIEGIDDDPQSIGYMLDDWEKELDRGKRKKVKNNRDSFGGENPFQDISPGRPQKKKKMDWTGSGNRPFSIYT